MNLRNIINHEDATNVDVRERFEFVTGHAEGAINIPLSTLPGSFAEFKKLSTPIVVYCRSGNRSGQVMGFLHNNGIKEVYNGGSLEEVVLNQNQKVSH